MKLNLFYFLSFAFVLAMTSCTNKKQEGMQFSPDKNLLLNFYIEEGTPFYACTFKGKTVVSPSSFSFDFKDIPSYGKNLAIKNIVKSSFTETWEMQWGEQRKVENSYNEMVVTLQEIEGKQRELSVRFKVYNEGIGFRYEFPSWSDADSLIILDENTTFQMTNDALSWWIPGDWDIYEHLYTTSLLSKINAIAKRNHPNLAQSYIPENAVNTPFTMKRTDGLYLSFHEADLTNYADMTLKIDTSTLQLCSELAGSDREGYKAKIPLPFQTPWRTILVTERAGDLIESRLIDNLNEPALFDVTGWFRPIKYVGVWWEMHMGKSSWDMASGKHGATTENVKKYIDFASNNQIGGVLVEGWNTGWERWIGFPDREGVFDFITPYSDYDLTGLVAYAEEKGVQLIMHHETSSAPRTYDIQKDTAYRLMNSLGINAVKTGYVGKIIPEGEYHHGQWMVNHYDGVIETASKYNIAVNAHEPIKGTGKRRTYPNEISREGLRGQEFNAWSVEKGNPSEHLTIVPFTRMLAGPIDFTPGIFNMKMSPYKNGESQVNTTLAHQLALYVVIYSPIQMAADLPENYIGVDAFQFIRDVGVDWEQSKVLAGEIGDFVVIAREERKTLNWFVGGVTDENERKIILDFSFLPSQVTFSATIYKDGTKAHWDTNPSDYMIEKQKIDSTSMLEIQMAPGGGFAISLFRE